MYSGTKFDSISFLSSKITDVIWYRSSLTCIDGLRLVSSKLCLSKDNPVFCFSFELSVVMTYMLFGLKWLAISWLSSIETYRICLVSILIWAGSSLFLVTCGDYACDGYSDSSLLISALDISLIEFTFFNALKSFRRLGF